MLNFGAKAGNRALLLAGMAGLALACFGCLRPQPPRADRPAVFAVVADIQCDDKDTAGARHYRTSLDRLEACVADLNQRRPAFVVQLGDCIDGYARNSPRNAVDHAAVMALLGRLEAPLYHTIGNHCLNLGRDRLRERYGLQSFYYDFTVPAATGWRFVVLDGNDAGYGIMGAEQLAWFGTTLERAAEAGERVICFCHFGLLKEAAAHHRMARPEAVLEAMDRYGCVAAWFAGHDHAGGYAVRNGVHHVTVKGMVEAPETNAYAIVEIHPDRLREVGLGSEPTREMPLPPGTGPDTTP